MDYTAWRISFQSSEQAARAAFDEMRNIKAAHAREVEANGAYIPEADRRISYLASLLNQSNVERNREIESLRQRVAAAEADAGRMTSALEGLVGVSALGDLHQMRAMLKLLGAPSDDEKAMVAAVDALIDRKDAAISAERADTRSGRDG